MRKVVMRKVIDSNFLQCNELREYLSKSRQNFAVLTDYAFMEAYKAGTLDMLYRSMKILCEYPKQVIVLKGTQIICGLSGRSGGLQRRLIDKGQTQNFAKSCKHLIAAQHGDQTVQTRLLHLANEARLQMDRILRDAQDFGASLEEITKLFSDEEIRNIRTGASTTEHMEEKFIKHICMMTASMFKRHPQVTKIPNKHEVTNTFIFRIALCMYILSYYWISVGGAKSVKAGRIRNDLIDVSFAAYATYFDGILSADMKVNAIYEGAKLALTNLSL